jgi:hypothetical protein
MRTFYKHCRGVLIYSFCVIAFAVVFIPICIVFIGGITPASNPAPPNLFEKIFGVSYFVFFFPSIATDYLLEFIGLNNGKGVWAVLSVASIPIFWGASFYMCVQLYHKFKGYSDAPPNN